MHTLHVEVPVSPEAPPREASEPLREAVAAAAGVPLPDLGDVRIERRSLDARAGRRPRWVLKCSWTLRSEQPLPDELPALLRPRHLATPIHGLHPIIVGSGPAGLFAALQFADFGVPTTLIERGSEVGQRNLQIRDLRVKGVLDAESNLCFGEGGAGTYSDGKLYTRGKSVRVREVYERLVALGIDRRILVDAHPHVGTNRLIPMMPKLRDRLREAGHTLRFDAKVVELVQDRGDQRVIGVRLADGEEILGGPVLLATGHSARDVYAMLARAGVAMERKDFAIGARIEHPQGLVDEAQLGAMAGWPSVGAAEYFVSAQVPTNAGVRGAYSFCMCPGGIVLPTPTRQGHLNVNGMSNEGRNSGIANAALVVQVAEQEMYLDAPGDLDDDPEFGAHVAGGALLGVALQGRLERRAFDVGGGGYRAPAERLIATVGLGAGAGDLPKSTYRPGLTPAPASAVLPARVLSVMRDAARIIDRRQMRGYLSEDALLLPVETTTSAPVRVLRGTDRQSTTHPGLYPCAEGAGYAGGIVSSAIDGMRSALAVLAARGLVDAAEVER
jgi:uncharacterized protein